MWTRRSGAACDTAQKSVLAEQPVPPGLLPVTLIVRFDSERQKLSSAMQSGAEALVVEH